MQLSDENFRSQSVGLMKEISSSKQGYFADSLDGLLIPPEKIIHRFVRDLSFQEGAWYRPVHNVIVPAAMIAICREGKFSRDLVYAALLHDAGNSLMAVADTIKGADWENPDKRFKHMQLGSTMTSTALLFLNSLGQEISKERIKTLANIVATHDYPYLGRELATTEELAHRDADRVFVPSVLSWYKDLIAHASDADYKQKADRLGMKISPTQFLLCRLSGFYLKEANLPQGWDSTNLPLKTEFSIYNEGGKQESANTYPAKMMVDYIFKKRAEELPLIENGDLNIFGKVFEQAFTEEMEWIISCARNP